MKTFLLFILCSLLLTGCGQKSGATLDAADEKDSRVSKGLELVQQKDWDDAVKQFDAALTKNPELGRPDLELAMIYHQQKKNYVRAVYHYERYLEKRPLTEKRALIQEWIKQAKVSLAGEVGGAGGDVAGELVRLTRENNMLRKQLETAGGASASPAASVKTLLTEPPPARPAPVAAPAPKPARTYTVRPGDTLSRISGAVYGDASQWKKIYEANREQMKTETDIQIGQTLAIPSL
ncbi:MAG: LysM peptidoglycan-binding domain-containing protein [Kiritimatiellaceae bacterium]|nr:LysM peptidoglycan-binding domain-containing protein [Kiritimatiellaceae bacterium]